MRKFISSLLALTLSLGIFGGVLTVSAAEGVVTQFEIIAPATSRVNEAIDVTIRAVDKDKNVVKGYRGSIIFVPENFGDTVPMPGKSIAFSAEDNGEKKFSKGVIFKTAGKQKVSVVDVSDDISGEATVNVEAGSTGSGSALEEVIIVSPGKDTKVTDDIVVVSGKSRKNSKLNVALNGKDVGSVLSDESGVFTKSITGITQSTNLLSVTLVDGGGVVIGKSQDINFEKLAAGPAFYNIVVTPGTSIEASTKVNFTVEADAGLSDVSLLMDGTSLKGNETAPGKYVIDTVSPAKAGEYPITVNLTNAVGQKTTQENAAKLTVTEKVASFDTVKATTQGTKVVFNFGVTNPPADLEKFKIAYGESADSFTSEAVTWNTGKIMKSDGRYEWYIDKLPVKSYSFKIMGMRADGTLIDALTSETLPVTVGNPTCTVGNVGAVKVETLSDKSILSWLSVTGAVSYNIYKIAANGDSTLFQNTKDTKYTLFLSSGAVVHEDFGVKALCDEETESPDFAKASKVQTGPGMVAILVVISGILGAFILRRRFL